MLALFFLILLIKTCLVSIGSQQQVRDPVWRSPHLFTDRIQRHIPAAFDNDLIVDMSYDEAAPEGIQGIAEDVPADGLGDVFHQLWAVGFNPGPVLLRVGPQIGNAFPAEPVFFQPRAEVGQRPAGGKLNKQRAVEEVK